MTQNYYHGRHVHPPMGHLPNGPVIPPRSQFPQQLPFHPQQQHYQQQYPQQQPYQSSYASSSSLYSQGGSHSRNGSTGNQGYGNITGDPTSSYTKSSPSSLRSNTSTPSTSSSSTTTSSSFQERMKERDRENRQRERQERDAAARAIREDPKLNIIANSMANAPAGPGAATTAQSTGTTIWNKLRAAKDIINTTITGEERWPDSDDSDYEGESHMTRTLRELKEKREADEIAQKISELEMTPYNANSNNKTLAKSPSVGSIQSHSGSGSRNQYLRDAVRGAPTSPTSPASPTVGQDYYGRPFQARGESIGHQQSRSEDTSSRRMRTRGESDVSNNSSGITKDNASGFNRYRTASDASRDEALSRLEGKRTADVLNAQISHLGSTSPRARTNSPHRGLSGRRPVPAPPSAPLPVPSNNNLGAYGQRKQLQLQQQQQTHGSNKPYF